MSTLEDVNESFAGKFGLPIQFFSPDAITNAFFTYEKLSSMAELIATRVQTKPLVAIVCGSGLGEIAGLVENPQRVAYDEIPDFPRSTVKGHKGLLVFGTLSELPVVCMQGRFHPYEGYSLALCTLPIKIFKLLGVKLVVLTNAAGGINPAYKVGDLMCIKDHLSYPLLALQHPLVGPHDERFGPRFTPINALYQKNLRTIMLECAKEMGVQMHEGVYGSLGGPTYETTTESRLIHQSGMDCVGMSTSHEAVVAGHCGLKCLALSIVTDKVSLEFDDEHLADHEEIVAIANSRAKDAEKLVAKFLAKVNQSRDLLD